MSNHDNWPLSTVKAVVSAILPVPAGLPVRSLKESVDQVRDGGGNVAIMQ